MQYYAKEVGLRIKKLRHMKNMTQVELAEKLHYASERQLQRIENGEIVCPTDRLVELASILDASTDYLLFGRESSWNWSCKENFKMIRTNNTIVIVLEDVKCKHEN